MNSLVVQLELFRDKFIEKEFEEAGVIWSSIQDKLSYKEQVDVQSSMNFCFGTSEGFEQFAYVLNSIIKSK